MKKLIYLALLFTSLQAVAGGPWVHKRWQGYFKVGQSLIDADQYFGPNGELVDFKTGFRFYTSSIYGEIGITDRLTVVTYMPFFVWGHINAGRYESSSRTEPSDEESGIGDSDISFKYGLNTKGNHKMSVSLTLGLPLGETEGGNTKLIQTGDGEFNQMISFDLGRGFSNGVYWSSMLGFNNRTEGFTDEVRYSLEGGISKGSFTALLRFYGIKPVSQSGAGSSADNGLFANRIEYLSFTPEIIYTHKDRFGVSASAGGVLYARRILAAPNLSFGGFIKF